APLTTVGRVARMVVVLTCVWLATAPAHAEPRTPDVMTLMADVARLRGWPPGPPIPIRMLDSNSFARALERYGPTGHARQGGPVLGFPARDASAIYARIAPAPALRATLVHEIEPAWQARRFALPVGQQTVDAALARLAAFEGEAEFVAVLDRMQRAP